MADLVPRSTEPLRIGILGAARITSESLVAPSRDGGARLVAIAARDRERAARFAADHGIERVADSYEALVTDPEVEVVYNPLPNSLHGPWNLAAIAAGKHVLTEKPFASNADEASVVKDAADRTGVVVFDGFHYRYHPVFERLLEIMISGGLGSLKHLNVTLRNPAPPENDLRWSLPLAGGALMDLGCYSLHVIQSVAAALTEVPQLLSAEAGERAGRPGVDEWCRAELGIAGATATAYCNMNDSGWEFSITAAGSVATVQVPNFVKVSRDDRLLWWEESGEAEPTRVEHLGPRSTYHYQLDALTAAVRTGRPFPTDAADAVASMELVDNCYRAAGMTPRPSHGPQV